MITKELVNIPCFIQNMLLYSCVNLPKPYLSSMRRYYCSKTAEFKYVHMFC